MQVSIMGKGHYSLNKNDFVASGGEGNVYRKADTAFKIYSDPRQMMPQDKIRELSVLSMPNIIRPQDVVLDEKGHPVGYTMKYLKNTYSMCQLFPKAFRDRMGLKPSSIIGMVRGLQDIVSHCHSNNVLIVDLNEMNFLVDDGFLEVYAIDCDSYQTKNFPATAIMESIRDKHSKGFSEKTDWFSFGIVSFQMFIGIHPYKGKHQKIRTIEERMSKNVSVFNKDVSIPSVCYPLTSIPSAYADWYKAVFDNGLREAPPVDAVASVVLVKRARISGSDNFIIRKIMVAQDDIIRFDWSAAVATTCKGIYDANGKQIMNFNGRIPAISITPNGSIIASSIVGDELKLYDATHGKDVPINIKGEEIMASGGRLYFKNMDKLFEMEFLEAAGNIFASPVPSCQVLDNATKMLDGVVMQDVLGSCYASIFPATKTCYQLHLKEIDGVKVIEGKYDGYVLVVVASDGKGKYNKHIFRLADDFQSYDHRAENDIVPAAPNFVVLPTGVCIYLNDKEEIELFSSRKGSGSIKVFSDPAISGDMRLSRYGTQVVFSHGDELYSMEVKKTKTP